MSAANRWTLGRDMPFLAGSSASALIGGSAYGAGATSRNVYNRIDIYNPQTNTWRLGTPMPTARHGIFLVLTGNRITVAGGGVQAGFSASSAVETYTVR